MSPARRLGVFGVLAALAGAGAWAWATRQAQTPALETLTLTRPVVTAPPAMCAWRNPSSDMAAFFPGADSYHTRLMVLSGLRVPIRQRLGVYPDADVLYAYTVFRRGARCGEVLTHRVAGEYGAMEVVVGVDAQGRVTGMRLQRLREPDAVARALTAPAWDGAFRGKTAGDAWRLGQDIPDVPPPARVSAGKVVDAVRALLIEYDVARRSKVQG